MFAGLKMFAWNLLTFILLTNYCMCFNISELLTSREKVNQLLEEEAKEEESTGYNLAKIKLANEVIIQLMDKGTRKEHGKEVLKLICEYTVGMNENSLDVVTLRDFKTMRRVYEEIYAYGQPPFIDHKCDITNMQLRLKWADGPVTYFNYIRKDALSAWNYFAEQFKIVTDKLKMVSPSFYT